MDLGLTDRVFLVTAASSGLGRATAEELVAEGARVVLVARRGEVLTEVVSAVGDDNAVSLTADLANPDTAEAACALALSRFGQLDGALISVGGPPAGSAIGTTEDQWRVAFESVFLAGLRVNNAVVRHGTAVDLAIAWVLSISAKSPIPGLAASNGLRPGLAMLIKQLADELGPQGTRVLGLMPGRIETERVQHLDSLDDDPAAARARSEAAIPLRRYGDPAEFGRVAAFLLSPAASYLTGSVVPVEGGALRGLLIAAIMPIDQVLELLCCPRCAETLTRQDGLVVCTAGHAFDLARQGYLNLLGRAAPANADTTEMVAARERFLSGGHYSGLADGLVAVLRDLPPGPWVEVGAGTAYYLAYALQRLGGRGIAIDISTAAGRRAARAHDQLGAVVADVWERLPIRDTSATAILCVFAPRNPAEFARILRPEGALVIAAPLPDHLVELRAPLGLLDVEADKQDRISRTLADQFTAVASAECRYRIGLDAEAVIDLVSMGPNAFHQDHRRLAARVAALDQPIEVTIAVAISAWRPLPRL